LFFTVSLQYGVDYFTAEFTWVLKNVVLEIAVCLVKRMSHFVYFALTFLSRVTRNLNFIVCPYESYEM